MHSLEKDVFEQSMRCPKRMKNGPCGSSYEGRCEVGGLCVWSEIYDKLKKEDMLSILDNVLGAEKYGYSPYSDRKAESFLDKKRFVVTTELDPPRGTKLSTLKKFLKNLEGADAVNVVDNPMGRPIMAGIFPSLYIMKHGLTPIYQITCRDRNLSAIQSDLFTAYATGIRDILVLTGDYVTKGAKPVFELDSTLLAYLVKTKFPNMLDFSGRKIDTEIVMNVGVAVNPNARPLDMELLKFKKKMHFADFAQTQAVFDAETLDKFASGTNFRDRTIVGVLPVTSLKMAETLANVPGVTIPDALKEELRADEGAGIRRARELIKQARELGFRGVHIMTFSDHKLFSRLSKECRK